jgi:3-oxoacyl-[acyl-carrier protein] reductase
MKSCGITEKAVRPIAVQADVSKPQDITRLFAETQAAYGKVDILVNNAGVYEFAPLESVNANHFHKLFDLNVLGLLLTTQEAVKHMNGDGGSIINISSLAGPMPFPTASVYSATKAAVTQCRFAFKELGPRKIRINSLNPDGGDRGVHAAGFFESDFRKTMRLKLPKGSAA